MSSYLCSNPPHRLYSYFCCTSRVALCIFPGSLFKCNGLRVWQGKSASSSGSVEARTINTNEDRATRPDDEKEEVTTTTKLQGLCGAPLRVIHGGAYLLCHRFLHCLSAQLSWIVLSKGSGIGHNRTRSVGEGHNSLSRTDFTPHSDWTVGGS